MGRNMSITKESVLTALQSVKYPGYSRDIVSFGVVRDVAVKGDEVRVLLEVSSQNQGVSDQIKSACEQALGTLTGVSKVSVDVVQLGSGTPPRGLDPWAGQRRVPGIKHVYAVASGKGGVGKSTVSVNLACAIKRLNKSVGLLDCDIYGPTIPLMMGVQQVPDVNPQSKIVPLENFGVKLMSIGFFLEDGQPVIWRGPMINKTIQQFLFEVDWGELDYLFVDLPPGTGDAQLSLCQAVPLDGGIIVTTPQEASLGVVRKGIAMFNKLNVPVVGLIENMSFFTTPAGENIYIFGQGGGKAEAQRQNIPFLGEIPIFTNIREGGDRGLPVAASEPDSPAGRVFAEIAERLAGLRPGPTGHPVS